MDAKTEKKIRDMRYDAGQKLKAKREKLGLSMEQVAEKFGGELTSTYISKLERAATDDLSVHRLLSYCKFFDISPDEVYEMWGCGVWYEGATREKVKNRRSTDKKDEKDDTT